VLQQKFEEKKGGKNKTLEASLFNWAGLDSLLANFSISPSFSPNLFHSSSLHFDLIMC
jgi:hypothetical protein